MKIMVINNTDLSIRRIGEIIDKIIDEGKEDTIYYGKKDKFIIKHLHSEKDYKIELEYLKSYTKWVFTETKPTYNNKEN